MDFDELLEKYRLLQEENKELKEKIQQLQTPISPDLPNILIAKEDFDKHDYKTPQEPETYINTKSVDKFSSTIEKIELFMSLFKGRDDVFAKRWENHKKETSGYSPACGNEWQPGICQKPKIKCSACKNKDYLQLDQQVVDKHLRGEIVIGIYPLLLDETCWFLAIDFDDEGWHQDVSALRSTCLEFDIPMVVERSRSGNGAHVWFFFEQPVTALMARKFGSALLTSSMDRRHQITFKSYDRLFPNQDTMPKGGFGNLIALPLQKSARENNNSVFINKNFEIIEDQWAFLSSVKKLNLMKLNRSQKVYAVVTNWES